MAEGAAGSGQGLAAWLRGRSATAGPERAGRTERLVRLAALTWILVGLAILGWVAFRLIWPVLVVIAPPLLVAALIVYALDPPVSALARRRLPRWLAAAAVYLALIVATGGLVAAATPLVASQIRTFADEVPDLRGQGKDLFEQGLGALGLDLTLGADSDGGEIAREVADEAGAAMDDEASRQRLAGALGGLAGVAAGTARLLVLLLLGPVVAFYLLADLPRVKRSLALLVPPRRREEVVELAAAVGRVTGGYVRGQLLIALVVGVLATAGFSLVGLPFWAVIGLIAGLTNLVPFVGPVIGGLLGISVALLTDGPGLALVVVLVVVVVQQVESQVLQPLIMGRTVEIAPVVVLLAVVVGGGLFGLAGLLLAVPAVASGKVIAAHLWHRHVPWAEDEGPPDPEDVDGVSIAPVSSEG